MSVATQAELSEVLGQRETALRQLANKALGIQPLEDAAQSAASLSAKCVDTVKAQQMAVYAIQVLIDEKVRGCVDSCRVCAAASCARIAPRIAPRYFVSSRKRRPDWGAL